MATDHLYIISKDHHMISSLTLGSNGSQKYIIRPELHARDKQQLYAMNCNYALLTLVSRLKVLLKGCICSVKCC